MTFQRSYEAFVKCVNLIADTQYLLRFRFDNDRKMNRMRKK